MPTLIRAIEIAQKAHLGETDKQGKPYILHPMRVMERCSGENEKICAVLHDVVEDSDWTFDMLAAEGFSDEIIEAIICLTKKKNEEYSDFIERISCNKIAVAVKLNDLRDNMDITRLDTITEMDIARLRKYLMSYYKLLQYKK